MKVERRSTPEAEIEHHKVRLTTKTDYNNESIDLFRKGGKWFIRVWNEGGYDNEVIEVAPLIDELLRLTIAGGSR